MKPIHVKYPRTLHLPWSPGRTDDDKVMWDTSTFEGQEIVVTEKMDGENTTMYTDGLHARSLDSRYHPSRSWVKGFWSTISSQIPLGVRICGENLYAKHSVEYSDLESYFLAFSVWHGDTCLPWADTVSMLKTIGVPIVPVLYQGVYDEKIVKSLLSNRIREGYVVRLADSFQLSEFPVSVGKYVRANHVQTDHHWMNQSVIPNLLKGT